MERDKSHESSKSPFTAEELRTLDAGRLAVLNLVIQALVETHPNPAELLAAFSAKTDAAKTLMRDLGSAQSNPVEKRHYLPVFQDLLDDDVTRWAATLTRIARSRNHQQTE